MSKIKKCEYPFDNWWIKEGYRLTQPEDTSLNCKEISEIGWKAALKYLEGQKPPTNTPIMPVCPNASVKWSRCACSIKNEVNPEMSDCDGKGSYTVIGNLGYQYSYQCNKVPGKPA